VKAVISLEWSVRKMKLEACPVEPPRVGERALVELHDVLPAQAGEMVGDAVPDDAGTDDDDVGVLRESAHRDGSSGSLTAH
jgi:hypothetical protein